MGLEALAQHVSKEFRAVAQAMIDMGHTIESAVAHLVKETGIQKDLATHVVKAIVPAIGSDGEKLAAESKKIADKLAADTAVLEAAAAKAAADAKAKLDADKVAAAAKLGLK